jgi:DNA-binding NtrC family response regulator
LFGHLKGGFTGAASVRKGMIEEAQDGTAFIDEIGDLDLNSQIQLLGVLDTNRIQQIGANVVRETNARFVFATHRNLEERINDKLFRPDLYARINILIIEVPPLRKRKADIPLLVEHFVERYNRNNETSVSVQAGAVDELFRYDWPLNVRELDGVVHRAAARAGVDGIITGTMLRESIRDPREFQSRRAAATQQSNSISVNPETLSWHTLVATAEAMYFKSLVEVAKNEQEAIRMCGLGRAQLYEKLRKYKLRLGR